MTFTIFSNNFALLPENPQKQHLVKAIVRAKSMRKMMKIQFLQKKLNLSNMKNCLQKDLNKNHYFFGN